MKIHPVGAEFFHADRRKDERTDMTKLTVALRSFANAPNKYDQSELILVGTMHGNFANKVKLTNYHILTPLIPKHGHRDNQQSPHSLPILTSLFHKIYVNIIFPSLSSSSEYTLSMKFP
jgi:hypothetical protein